MTDLERIREFVEIRIKAYEYRCAQDVDHPSTLDAQAALNEAREIHSYVLLVQFEARRRQSNS